MIFKPEPKIEHVNKTLYMKSELAEKIQRIACQYNISFSRVITTIVEGFFERMEHESSEE